MARAATIGNGSILVGIDERGQVRDFYYPFVGHANHVSGGSGSYWHRIGVWVDGAFSWIEEDGWQVVVDVHPKKMSTSIVAINERLKITLTFKDVVHNEQNIFLRNILVSNNADTAREIKVFFAQEFRISESRRGDTGMYDPRVKAIIHYKGHNVFLINAEINGKPFSDYSIGIFDIEGKDGTFRDAEDGRLERNSIEHGSVDSVIGLSATITAFSKAEINYWVVVGENIPEAHALNGYVITEHPERIRKSVENYWSVWLEKDRRDLTALPKPLQELYQKSLQIIRVHADKGGGIIASGDSEMLNHGRDNYSYVWPRDAVVAADALRRGGYIDAAKRFYVFLSNLLEPDGYLMHKYRVDGALGSSWHSWMRGEKVRLPIQEDETSSILFFLWKQYEDTHDVEFIESLYNIFIEPTAEFLCSYIDDTTGLPFGSYDLWEEKFGTSTYTAASVYGGLMAAASFSHVLGKQKNVESYTKAAQRIKEGILRHMYIEEEQLFVKLVRLDDGILEYDRTIDSSSFFGLILFGVLDIDDERVVQFKKIIDEKLFVGSGSDGGYVRYENDRYYTAPDTGTPNPWIVCTLWMAQYAIRIAKTRRELTPALEMLLWAHSTASKSGILAEQIHPLTKAPLSTAPLVWSHSEYVITLDEYLKKYRSLNA